MRQAAVCMALAFLPVTILSAAEPTVVQRYVELRDGSVLRVGVVDDTWKVPVVKSEGKIGEAAVHIADFETLSFTPERIFEKKKALLATIVKLGADEFEDRENAQRDLIRMGAAVRTDLELVKDRFTDLEIKSRIANILAELPVENKPAPSFPFDVFQGGKELLWGDAGDAGITIQLDGKSIRLTRKEVASLATKPPDPTLVRTGAGAFKQLDSTDYPNGCIEEGFDTTPEGRKLKIGENVEKLFIAKGFTLSTSIKTSYVSVNDYLVQGKTHGLSCATHQPLFHGEITITFCKPGNENVPAAVHYFGTWIAYVEINGTALHAYDFQNREIGKVAVRKREHDFLGFYSPVPVHKVTVVPNLQIDPDYTLDDFIFTPPRPAEPAHPERCLVQFVDGERLLCADVAFSPEGVTAKGLSAGLPDRTRPYEEVVRIAAPDKKEQDQKPPPGVFVELQDGSILFAAKDKAGPAFSRKPDLLKQTDDIVGVWGSGHGRPTWPAKAPAVGKMQEGKGMTWLNIAKVKLEADHIDRDGPDKGVASVAESYYDSPPVLLKVPTYKEAGSWRFKTTQGDELVLCASGAPTLSGTLLGELKLKWDGKEHKMTVSDIQALIRLPTK